MEDIKMILDETAEKLTSGDKENRSEIIKSTDADLSKYIKGYEMRHIMKFETLDKLIDYCKNFKRSKRKTTEDACRHIIVFDFEVLIDVLSKNIPSKYDLDLINKSSELKNMSDDLKTKHEKILEIYVKRKHN